MAQEPKRRSPQKTALIALLQLACVGYVAHVLWKERTELAKALDLSASALFVLLLLMWLAHLQRSLEFTYMLRKLGVNEPFWAGFWLTGAGYLLNHLPFNAGFVMRASFLKKDHSLSYTKYVSLTMVNALVNVAVGALFGIVAAVRGVGAAEPQPLAFFAFTAIVVGAVAVIFWPRGFAPKGSGFIARHLGNLVDGVVLIRGNGVGILFLAFLALTRLVGVALRLSICFAALGAEISPLGAAILAWGTVLFTLVNVTPGNLGLRELVLSLAAVELGSTQALGMAAASMDRVVMLAYVVMTGIPGLYSLRRRGPFRSSEGST